MGKGQVVQIPISGNPGGSLALFVWTYLMLAFWDETVVAVVWCFEVLICCRWLDDGIGQLAALRMISNRNVLFGFSVWDGALCVWAVGANPGRPHHVRRILYFCNRATRTLQSQVRVFHWSTSFQFLWKSSILYITKDVIFRFVCVCDIFATCLLLNEQ